METRGIQLDLTITVPEDMTPNIFLPKFAEWAAAQGFNFKGTIFNTEKKENEVNIVTIVSSQRNI